MPKVPPVSRFVLAIEYFREEDGRWLADIPALPGVTAYGRTRKQATAAVQPLAEHGEAVPGVLLQAGVLDVGGFRLREARPTVDRDLQRSNRAS